MTPSPGSARQKPAPAVSDKTIQQLAAQEAGLARQLSTRQMTMIAIGGAIGTGLFLGSGLAVHEAGPGVILTYALGAAIALLLVGALAEMAVAHPAAGSFGVYAELYLSRWAGFAVRYTYWAAQSIAIGGEATAVGIYCGWWWPQVPQWVWIVGFSAALLYVNARSVAAFGEFEYWFALIKVIAILLFIAFGAWLLSGLRGGAPGPGAHFTSDGGFLPLGLAGVWRALCFVIFSYIGSEIVAVTAGEARDPATAVPRAMRSMLGRLTLFYVGAITVLVGVVPWNRIGAGGGGITASPFVTVFRLVGFPAATHAMNFVVVTAALSSMNTNLYLATRMIFSLARGGYAPAALGRVSSRGAPVPALLLTAAGLAVATVVNLVSPDRAYVLLFGVALFGGLFVWLMVFLTHLRFRPAWERSGGPRLPVRMIGFPYTSLAGAGLLVAILITTWWIPGMRPALAAGIPWLGVVTAGYWIWARRAPRRQ
ncbi:MAG TPA: amino acid permease [Candidatus Acidoferrales bacterium]|nr:amino acid permease [Candidatus Acidoferrales bacterium]